MTVAQPTLALSARPQPGAKVEIRGQRIRGELVRSRPAMQAGYWWLDILPATAISASETLLNVWSGRVSYIDSDGSLRPVSPESDEPQLGGAA